jgi:hypothetical protein
MKLGVAITGVFGKFEQQFHHSFIVKPVVLGNGAWAGAAAAPAMHEIVVAVQEMTVQLVTPNETTVLAQFLSKPEPVINTV